MQNNENIRLIERAKNFGVTTIITEREINFVQNKLSILLPDDFKVINAKASYEDLNYFEFYNFRRESNSSVIGNTLLGRTRGLAKEYLILAFDTEMFVLMKINEDNKSEVIICNYWDFENLCNNKPMEHETEIFPSFAEFYEFLLDEEEKLRAEE